MPSVIATPDLALPPAAKPARPGRDSGDVAATELYTGGVPAVAEASDEALAVTSSGSAAPVVRLAPASLKLNCPRLGWQRRRK